MIRVRRYPPAYASPAPRKLSRPAAASGIGSCSDWLWPGRKTCTGSLLAVTTTSERTTVSCRTPPLLIRPSPSSSVRCPNTQLIAPRSSMRCIACACGPDSRRWPEAMRAKSGSLGSWRKGRRVWTSARRINTRSSGPRSGGHRRSVSRGPTTIVWGSPLSRSMIQMVSATPRVRLGSHMISTPTRLSDARGSALTYLYEEANGPRHTSRSGQGCKDNLAPIA
jgi:hypothetical protein